MFIETTHPKWGSVRFSVEKFKDTDDGPEYIRFFYPSGAEAGWWDRTGHGSLWHPCEVVQNFLAPYRAADVLQLEELDRNAYELLHALVKAEVKRVLPDFLREEVESDD